MQQGGRQLPGDRDRELDTVGLIAGYLAGALPQAVRTRDLILRRPWPADTMGGSVSGGDISDPTGETAAQPGLEELDHIYAVRKMMIACAMRLDRYVRETPKLKPADDSLTCSCRGMKGSMTWGPKLPCDRNADTRDGLCYRCYKRRWSWQKEQEEHERKKWAS